MFNETIKSLRIARHISQVELAQELNVSKQCVSNWENDNIQPSIEMLIKIADYFNVTTDYLLDREQETRISVEELTEEQIAHICQIIDDLKKANKH
jgi:transcriptional regulator with XRE-family HTH domain